MKITAEYKGKTIEIDIPDEKLEELVKEQKKTGWEKVGSQQNYFSIDSFDYSVRERVSAISPTDINLSSKLWNVGNHFTSKELAENIAHYQSLDLRIRRRIAEICEPLNWSNCKADKYVIDYNHHYIELVASNRKTVHCSGWHCDTEEHAHQIINEFREELMWYFTEFKDRMDG